MPPWTAERQREYAKAYYRKHRDTLRERSKVNARAYRDRIRDSLPARRRRHFVNARAKQYGVTPEEVDRIVAVGRCAICGTDTAGGKHDTWNVDHDHATGCVRKALCNACNRGIGELGDSPDRLRAAAAYIEEHFDKWLNAP